MPTNSGVVLKSEEGRFSLVLKDKTVVNVTETAWNSCVEVERKNIKFRVDGTDNVFLWKRHDGGVSVEPVNELSPKELKALLPKNIVLLVKNYKAIGIEIIQPLYSKSGK